MESSAETRAERRNYRRRSDDERIADLESRIAQLKAQKAVRQKRENPVMKEIPKIQKRLRKFAQMAMDHTRPDIANSVTAFTAGLDRYLSDEAKSPKALPPIEEE